MNDEKYSNTGRTATAELDHETRHDANPDPITGAPGAHPVGTGVGAASGAVAGAALAWIDAKHAVKDSWNRVTDRTEHDSYWRENHATRPYYKAGHTYDDDYAPAYRYGYDSARTHAGRTFDQSENDLQHGWEQTKGK